MAAITAAVIGGVLGAGGSIAGGLLSKPKGVRPGDLPFTALFPYFNPLGNALSQQALLGLGQVDPSLGLSAGPIGDVINAITSTGAFKKSSVKQLLPMLQTFAKTGILPQGEDKNLYNQFYQAIAMAGYSDASKLYQDQQAFQQREQTYQQNALPVAQQVQRGQLAAYGDIANIAQNFPSATASDLQGLTDKYAQAIQDTQNLNYSDLTKQLMQQANQGNFNPAAYLGRLAQQQILDREQIPLLAQSEAQQNLGGRIGLSNAAIQGLYGAINPAYGNAAAASGQSNNFTANAAQIAAAQGQQAAGLQVNQSNLGLQALGAGLSGATQNITGALQNYALYRALASGPGGPNSYGMLGQPSYNSPGSIYASGYTGP